MRPGLLPTLGVVGLTACGPGAPQDTADATGTDTGDGPTTDTTSDPPTTVTTVTTGEPPTPTTTIPPECQGYDDCAHLYCGYCDGDGVCREGVGCCDGLDGARCSPPYDCYGDYDCDDDEICEFGECIPVGPQLPACDPEDGFFSEWNLSVTPTAFVLADLDADGDLDLAAAQPSVAQIEIALNDGAGGFVLAGAFGVGAPTMNLALAAGDLDADGDIDLAVTRGEPDGGLVLAFGQGAVFTPQPLLPTPTEPLAVHVRAVDGDALADVVVVAPANVTTRLGADLMAELTAIPDPVGADASLFDFDGDGRLDVVASVPGGTAVGVWTGDGDGTFTPKFSIDPGLGNDAVLVADLNLLPLPPADDLPHLVFARTTPEGVGQIDVWPVLDTPQMFDSPVTFLTTAPISGGALFEFEPPDGPDLVAATGQPFVLIVPGDGAGGFACERTLPLTTPTVQSLLAPGDLDGDGRADLVVGDANSTAVAVLLTVPL